MPGRPYWILLPEQTQAGEFPQPAAGLSALLRLCCEAVAISKEISNWEQMGMWGGHQSLFLGIVHFWCLETSVLVRQGQDFLSLFVRLIGWLVEF